MSHRSEPDRPAPVRVGRAVVAWSAAWVFAAALYLLLIDITQLPELLVAAGAATLAATGAELARAQDIVGESVRLPYLRRVHRPLLKLPGDVIRVSAVAVAQLFSRRSRRGTFRAVRFRNGPDLSAGRGRRSLAESLGSFAPNTVIVGIDTDRELLLAHQLKPTGGPEAIDVLELG